MKKIQLNRKFKNVTNGYVVLVDDEDFEWLNKTRWNIFTKKYTSYASGTVNKKHVLMHRIIMMAEKGQEVDHIDGNGLNNQKSNLRVCTHQQNMTNRKTKNNKKYLGTHYYRNKYWFSSLTHNNKSIYLGLFKTEEEAALAYNKKAIELHGEFARLNIIE